jgi:hypothetical protein
MPGEHNEVKLLPCPFCGNPAPIGEIEDHFGNDHPCVRCSVCPVELACDTEERAIAAWNTRPSASPDTALVERVRDYIYDCTKDDCGHGWTLSAEQTRHVIALAALNASKGEE